MKSQSSKEDTTKVLVYNALSAYIRGLKAGKQREEAIKSFQIGDQSGIKKHLLNWSINQGTNMILEQTIMAS